MKAIFTRASSKPGEGVTVTFKRVLSATGVDFDPEPGYYILLLRKPKAKKHTQVVFWTTRGTSTLYTSIWPENFPQPKVGEPVEVELADFAGPFSAEDLGIA
jgi:hypothetical protein